MAIRHWRPQKSPLPRQSRINDPGHKLPLDAEAPDEKLNLKKSLLTASVLITSLAIAVIALIIAYRRTSVGAASAFQRITLSRQTSSGKAMIPAISRDGKYVAYVAEDGDLQSLWVRQAMVNSGVQIVAPAEAKFIGVTFSPDDNHIYYVTQSKSELINKLYQVPLLGGAPREVMTDVGSPITFSPNGQYFAFVRNYPSQRETSLIIASPDGSEERKLSTRKGR